MIRVNVVILILGMGTQLEAVTQLGAMTQLEAMTLKLLRSRFNRSKKMKSIRLCQTPPFPGSHSERVLGPRGADYRSDSYAASLPSLGSPFSQIEAC